MASERLEPDDAKVSSPVLRGAAPSNVGRLLGSTKTDNGVTLLGCLMTVIEQILSVLSNEDKELLKQQIVEHDNPRYQMFYCK